MLFARDLMTPTLVTLPEDADLPSIAEILTQHGITGAPVRDSYGVLTGILCESDLVRALSEPDGMVEMWIAGEPFEDPEDPFEDDSDEEADADRLRAKDLMTPGVPTISAEASVAEIATVMLETGSRRLLVLDQGKFVGILTHRDLVRGQSRHAAQVAKWRTSLSRAV